MIFAAPQWSYLGAAPPAAIDASIGRRLLYGRARWLTAQMQAVAAIGPASAVAGPLYNKIGMRVVIGVGTGFIALGAVLLALLIGADADYLDVAPGLLALGIGCGMFYPR